MESEIEMDKDNEISFIAQEEQILKDNFEYIHKLLDKIENVGFGNLTSKSREQMEKAKDRFAQVAARDEVPGPSHGTVPEGEKKSINNNGNETNEKPEMKRDANNYDADDSDDTQASNRTRSSLASSTGYKDLVKALHKMDNRKMSSIKKYGDDSVGSLKEYFVKFELYCEDSVRPNKMYWIDELESHLEGKALEAFQSQKDEDDSYSDIKRKLLEWDKNMIEIRKSQNKKRFKSVEMKESESLYLYSCRLERLYKNAYQGRTDEKKKKLIDKYISTIPKSSGQLLTKEIFSCKMRDQSMSWSKIQKCAVLMDSEDCKKKETKSTSFVKEISINAGKNMQENKQEQQSKGQHREFYNSNRGSPPSNYFRTNKTNGDYRNNGRRNGYNQNGNPRCQHCNWWGHEYENCPVRLNRCFRCNSTEHRKRDCPEVRKDQHTSAGGFSGNSNQGYKNQGGRNYNQNGNYGNNFRKNREYENKGNYLEQTTQEKHDGNQNKTSNGNLN